MQIIFNFIFHSDIDECERNIHNCSSLATCTDTDGGYYCNCTSGYTGNGKTCAGKTVYFLLI